MAPGACLSLHPWDGAACRSSGEPCTTLAADADTFCTSPAFPERLPRRRGRQHRRLAVGAAKQRRRAPRVAPFGPGPLGGRPVSGSRPPRRAALACPLLGSLEGGGAVGGATSALALPLLRVRGLHTPPARSGKEATVGPDAVSKVMSAWVRRRTWRRELARKAAQARWPPATKGTSGR